MGLMILNDDVVGAGVGARVGADLARHLRSHLSIASSVEFLSQHSVLHSAALAVVGSFRDTLVPRSEDA